MTRWKSAVQSCPPAPPLSGLRASVREVGGHGTYLADAVEAGIVRGPWIYAAGAPLSQTGGHADLHGLPVDVVDDVFERHIGSPTVADGADDCRRLVRRQLRLGARVIKVERAEGDFARAYDDVVHGESAYFVWLNSGKESIAVDLREADDLALVRSMLRRADVFVQNLSPGAAERAGLLARAAVAAGVDALFIECHPDPSRAASDASTQQPLEALPALLRRDDQAAVLTPVRIEVEVLGHQSTQASGTRTPTRTVTETTMGQKV